MFINSEKFVKGVFSSGNDIKEPFRIAGFDLDDTLIKYTRSKMDNQWELLDGVVDKITELISNNYIIVIFTNQSGFDKKEKWMDNMIELIKQLTKTSKNYYVAVYVSKCYDVYRKPNLGMWKEMKSDLKASALISKKSFFCGDAGGRVDDHSDVDRKFALNIGIDYFTPENMFQNNTTNEKFKLSGVVPSELFKTIKSRKICFEPQKKELIIMVGFQGSGKSDFIKKYISGYQIIGNDICKSKAQCIKLATEFMEKGMSVVIDNTNPDVESRKIFIDIAKKYKYKNIRAIVMNTSRDVANHMNNVRHIYSNGKIPKLPKIVYNIYNKKFKKPTTSEGFNNIETIDYVLDKKYFDNPKWKKAFMLYSEKQ